MNSNTVGSIHSRIEKKTGKKVYYVSYRVFDVEKGKKVQTTKHGFKLKKDAQKFLDEITGEIHSGRYVAPQKTTVKEVGERWLEKHTAKLRPNTKNWYRVNFENHIVPAIGKLPIQEVTEDILQQLYDRKREDGLSPTTVSYIHRTIKMIFAYAVKHKYVAENISEEADLTFDKKEEPEMVILTQEELIEVLRDKLPWDNSMAIPMALGGLMGLRRGEVLGLLWSDINFATGRLTVAAQRTRYDQDDERSKLKTENSKRTLQIPDIVMEMLEYQKHIQLCIADKTGYSREKVEEGFVCVNLDLNYFGRAYSPTHFNRIFARTVKDLGLPYMRFHDLRHSYATNLIHMQIPLTTVSKLMGHRSPDITLKIYAHAVDRLSEKDFVKINEAMNQNLMNA